MVFKDYRTALNTLAHLRFERETIELLVAKSFVYTGTHANKLFAHFTSVRNPHHPLTYKQRDKI